MLDIQTVYHGFITMLNIIVYNEEESCILLFDILVGAIIDLG